MRKWLKKRFTELDLLPEYFTAAAQQWQSLLWGGALLAVAWGLWFILGSPPRWVNESAIGLALFIAGYYVWRADHIRLQPKLQVTRIIAQPWKSAATSFYENSPMPPSKAGSRSEAIAYYFEITGTNEAASIRDVRVQLAGISPPVPNLDWLPVLLFHKHDHPPHKEKFDLHPGDVKNIDLVSAFRWDNHFAVRHIVDGVNCDVPAVGHHCLMVAITASDTPKITVSFDVFMDANGVLQCNIMESLSSQMMPKAEGVNA